MPPADLALVALASLLGAFVKSVTGMGYPLIAIPALTLAIGIEAAVVVIAIPNAIANLLLNLDVRHERAGTRDLGVLVATMAIGAVGGTFVLIEAPERPLLIALALSIFAFVVQRARRPDLRLAPATTRRWAPGVGLVAGLAQGAVGVSGPVIALWFHGYRLPPGAFVYSVTALFLVAGIAQLGVLVVADAFTRDRLIAAAVALVATLAMIPVGTRVRSRLGGAAFERAILALLVASGFSLIWRATR